MAIYNQMYYTFVTHTPQTYRIVVQTESSISVKKKKKKEEKRKTRLQKALVNLISLHVCFL